jgi:hypothetical protein
MLNTLIIKFLFLDQNSQVAVMARQSRIAVRVDHLSVLNQNVVEYFRDVDLNLEKRELVF